MNINPHKRAGMRITKMLIHETGTYNQQYRRPYQTHLDGQTLGILSERLESSDKFMPSMMAGVASQFISPSAQPEKQILMPNGWNERRLRFMMEIEHTSVMGSTVTEVVLGYTNYAGISVSGHVDPQMEFFVNSVLQVRKTIEHTPFGNQVYSNVADSSHVLADNNWSSMYSTEKDWRMRPTDVFATMSRAHLPDVSSTVDMRATLTHAAVKSRRSNNLAANYMAGILENYKNASHSNEFGQGAQEILSSARGYSEENSALHDPFLAAVAEIRGTPVGNVFKFGDLQAIDPNVDQVTAAVHMADTQRATVHQAGQTADWGSATRDTSLATILSQSVPSLMMDLMLTRIVFKSSNRFIGGQITTAVMDVQGFSNMDLSEYVRMFQVRLEHEILKDVTYNNALDFAIEMQVDLLGETWIKLAIDNGPFIDYVTPSFCDALTVPVLTNNAQNSMTLATDFDSLFTNIQGNLGSGSGAGNSIGMFGKL